MRILYFCTTPLQVLTALNMRFNNVIHPAAEGDASDIAVVDIFKSAKEIADKLKDTGLFEKIYMIEEEDHKSHPNGKRKALGIARDTLFPKRLLKQQFGSAATGFLKVRYDVIVSSVFSHTVAGIRTLNRGADYVMMDDGLASYFGDWTKRLRSSGYLKLLKLRNFGVDVSIPKKLYLMQPEMLQSAPACEVEKLPAFSDEFVSVAQKVFDTSDEGSDYSKKVVWLSHVSNTDEKKSGTQRISNVLRPYKSDVIVRRHPREKEVDAYAGFECDDANGMWELLLGRMDIESKLIVTLGSTGAFTSKILYDREPRLVFLYKLIPLPNGSSLDEVMATVKKFKEMYARPEHICEPESWEAFSGLIDRFLKE